MRREILRYGGVALAGLVTALVLRGCIERRLLGSIPRSPGVDDTSGSPFVPQRTADPNAGASLEITAPDSSAPDAPESSAPNTRIPNTRTPSTSAPNSPANAPDASSVRPPDPDVPPRDLRVPFAEVLAWAEKKTVPKAVARPREDSAPAGLEILGASRWVAGIAPGDRLVRVAGAGVASVDAVVERVLVARARGERSVVATFARRTAAGWVEYTVAFEQPY